MHWFQLKMHQNAFGGQTRWGALPQIPYLDSRGPTSDGKEGGMRPILYPDLGDRSPWQPSYLYYATEEYRSTKVLRSASAPLLQRPHVNTVFSSCAFSAAAPAVWKSLDINVRSAETFLTFRRKLKTELFRKSYDTWTLGRHRCARFTCDGHFICVANHLN